MAKQTKKTKRTVKTVAKVAKKTAAKVAKPATPKTPAKAATVPAKTKPAAAAVRDPRLPAPGTVITRTRKGKDHKVTVLEQGFRYEGETFKSLSAVANHIAGGSNNGFLFFHLIPRKTKEEAR